MIETEYKHVFLWGSPVERKGQLCKILSDETTATLVQVAFVDGVTQLVPRRALRRFKGSRPLIAVVESNEQRAAVVKFLLETRGYRCDVFSRASDLHSGVDKYALAIMQVPADLTGLRYLMVDEQVAPVELLEMVRIALGGVSKNVRKGMHKEKSDG